MSDYQILKLSLTEERIVPLCPLNINTVVHAGMRFRDYSLQVDLNIDHAYAYLILRGISLDIVRGVQNFLGNLAWGC